MQEHVPGSRLSRDISQLKQLHVGMDAQEASPSPSYMCCRPATCTDETTLIQTKQKRKTERSITGLKTTCVRLLGGLGHPLESGKGVSSSEVTVAISL